MVKHRFVFAGFVVISVLGLLMSCNKKSNPVGLTSPELLGVWTGENVRLGGGGYVLDSNGVVVINSHGDTLKNYDTAYIVLTITPTNFSILRANATKGSSLYQLDSTEGFGTWSIVGNSVIFNPTDSNFYEDSYTPWFKCDNSNVCNAYPPLPPDTLSGTISGNTWVTSIFNPKLAIKLPTTLTRQQ